MTVIIRVAITTLGCAVTPNVVCPPPPPQHTATHTVAHTHLIWEQAVALWQCSWSWLTSACAPGASAPAASPQSSWTFWSSLRKRGRTGRIYSAVKFSGQKQIDVASCLAPTNTGRGHPPVYSPRTCSNTSRQIISSWMTDLIQWLHLSSVRKPWHQISSSSLCHRAPTTQLTFYLWW